MAQHMDLAYTPRWYNAKRNLIHDYCRRNIPVYVIDVAHVCDTDESLEQYLDSRSPPIKCVLIEQHLKRDILRTNRALKGKLCCWCPNCSLTTFEPIPRIY